jgi:hypothetical protein
MSEKIILHGVLSYASVFKPRSINGGEEKYSICLIMKKDLEKKYGNKVKIILAYEKLIAENAFLKGAFKKPLRDGTEREAEGFENCYFINANSNTPPGIISKNFKPIVSDKEIYSGCFIRASITLYAFNTNGNKGIACALNNIQKISDGERLDTITTAEEDFKEFADFADSDDDMLLNDNDESFLD